MDDEYHRPEHWLTLWQIRKCCQFVLAIVLTSLSFAQPALSASQEETEAQLRKLKANIQEVMQWLEKADKDKSSLVKDLRKQEKDIAKTTIAIAENKRNISKLLGELSELNQQLAVQKASLDAQKAYLIEELRALYLEGQQPMLKALLDQDNPQSNSRYLAYFSYLQDARSETIDTFAKDVAELEKTQADILRRQTRIHDERKSLESRRKELNAQAALRKRTIAKLNENIANKSSELVQLQEDQSRLEALLEEVERAISELELPDESSPFKGQKSKLPWPTRGKVVERFGSRLAQGKLRSNGIRISAKQNSSVAAVHYGRVVFADWLRGFGLLIIIDHGDGYLSLYGNNESLLRDAGDWVSPGEEIAYVGNSGGLSTASLYFEIRKDGKPQNPTKWLKK